MIGPPSSGERMLAAQLPGLLPSHLWIEIVRRKRLKRRFGEDRAAVSQLNPGENISSSVFEFLRRIAHAECMGATAAASTGFARLIFPVFLGEKNHVYPPYHDWFAWLDRLRWVNKISPNDVPARMIVMRLNGPGSRTAFRFERERRRRV